MSPFDNFSAQLWEEAKRFFEKAIDAKNTDSQNAFLHSSILIGMSALEAYINSICEELLTYPDIPLHEKSLLKEREVEFEAGEFRIGDNLQIYRLVDRIEFLFYKCGSVRIGGNSHQWYSDLKASIKLRNSLVHPKEEVRVTEGNTKLLLESINTCLEQVSKCVYKKPFPFVALGLQSRLTF
jgi:hypothetical protein